MTYWREAKKRIRAQYPQAFTRYTYEGVCIMAGDRQLSGIFETPREAWIDAHSQAYEKRPCVCTFCSAATEAVLA